MNPMTTAAESSPYLLGTSDSEHDRLIRQAQLLAPYTERFFRAAGIGEGQRVLDVGSGVGDVALLLARLVGPTGHVLGMDIDTGALAKARTRATLAGLTNVQFIERSVEQLSGDAPFDAVVGRLILQFLPNLSRVMRTLVGLVRPGGVLAFQEPSYVTFLNQTAHLPLRKACANLVFETFRSAGVRTNMETALYQGFQEAGLPRPHMSLEAPLGHDAMFRRWLFDLMCTVRPRLDECSLMRDGIGYFATLEARLDRELDAYNSYAGCIALVGAWSRKPQT
jgi:ubiquinone/menaquinone biosynthesis C-methylase UbiE